MTLSTQPLNPVVIRQQLQLSQERMSRLLHVSTKTLWRWESTPQSPNGESLARLVKLKQIAELAEKVYTPEGIEAFLFTPLLDLDNRTAYDLMTLGEFESILGALAADYEGLGF